MLEARSRGAGQGGQIMLRTTRVFLVFGRQLRFLPVEAAISKTAYTPKKRYTGKQRFNCSKIWGGKETTAS